MYKSYYIFVHPIAAVCSFCAENVDRLRLAVSFECGTDETYPTEYVDTPSGAVCSSRAENVRQTKFIRFYLYKRQRGSPFIT